MLLGTARAVQEAEDRASRLARTRKSERRGRERERRREALEARIAALRAKFIATEDEAAIDIAEAAQQDEDIGATERLLRERRSFNGRPAPSPETASSKVTVPR